MLQLFRLENSYYLMKSSASEWPTNDRSLVFHLKSIIGIAGNHQNKPESNLTSHASNYEQDMQNLKQVWKYRRPGATFHPSDLPTLNPWFLLPCCFLCHCMGSCQWVIIQGIVSPRLKEQSRLDRYCSHATCFMNFKWNWQGKRMIRNPYKNAWLEINHEGESGNSAIHSEFQCCEIYKFRTDWEDALMFLGTWFLVFPLLVSARAAVTPANCKQGLYKLWAMDEGFLKSLGHNTRRKAWGGQVGSKRGAVREQFWTACLASWAVSFPSGERDILSSDLHGAAAQRAECG